MSQSHHTRTPSTLVLPNTVIQDDKVKDSPQSTKVPPTLVVSSIWNHPLFPHVLAGINNLNPTQPPIDEPSADEIIYSSVKAEIDTGSSKRSETKPNIDQQVDTSTDEKNDDHDELHHQLPRVKTEPIRHTGNELTSKQEPNAHVRPSISSTSAETLKIKDETSSSSSQPTDDPILQEHIEELLRKYLLYLRHEKQELNQISTELENTTSLSQLLLAQAQVDISASTISSIYQHQQIQQPFHQELYQSIIDSIQPGAAPQPPSIPPNPSATSHEDHKPPS